MRYSIMLQLVVATTLVLTGAAAFFAWLQNRPTEADMSANRSQTAILRGVEVAAYG
ncbi:MAG TPA: hypothetical protein VEZ50_04260 [Nodosilinea sp.]|nr:hypothetical protein [Nodosilinea sp.]